MKINRIKETCLYVQDLERTKEFYHNKLELPLISLVKGRHVFFRVGPSVLLCFIPEVTKNEKALPPHYAYGRQHVAFEVSLGQYENWFNKIKKGGIEIIHVQGWKENLKSFYFHDPDQHVIEIVPPGIWD